MKTPSCDLNGRVILVTGSTGHLGTAITKGLAGAGATVLLASRSVEKITDQLARLQSAGGTIHSFPCDITSDSQRQSVLKEIAERFGRLDGIVNNAYAQPKAKGAAAFLEAYNISVASVWALLNETRELLSKAAARNRGGASIVNIASMYGLVSPDLRMYSEPTPPNPPFYGAAKAGLLQLTRYLACELGLQNIRVNSISPGPFPAPTVGETDPEFIKHLGARNPLGRIGTPEELIGPVQFLLSDASSYVTGANLCVDGGWTAW